jgi:hypothetical protein
MRRRGDAANADIDGTTEDTNARVQFGGGGEIEDRGTADSGAATGGDTGGELSTAGGGDSSGPDSGDRVPETPKRKRGRPVGTKSTNTGLGSERRKLADTFTGAVGFLTSWYGVRRANRYKEHSFILAQQVYQCYQITPEQGKLVGEPLADTFCLWFPQYVKTVSKGIDPGLAMARAFTLLQQLSDNEKFTVARFMQGAAIPTNGQSNPASGVAQDPAQEWMKQQTPQPEDIREP